jgi:Putative transposase of IS4/5 family (DUF4096)
MRVSKENGRAKVDKSMAYPSDVTEEERLFVADLFDTGSYGNRRQHGIRVLLSALFYLNRTGCQWCYLTAGFATWKTVFQLIQPDLASWRLEPDAAAFGGSTPSPYVQVSRSQF